MFVIKVYSGGVGYVCEQGDQMWYTIDRDHATVYTTYLDAACARCYVPEGYGAEIERK